MLKIENYKVLDCKEKELYVFDTKDFGKFELSITPIGKMIDINFIYIKDTFKQELFKRYYSLNVLMLCDSYKKTFDKINTIFEHYLIKYVLNPIVEIDKISSYNDNIKILNFEEFDYQDVYYLKYDLDDYIIQCSLSNEDYPNENCTKSICTISKFTKSRYNKNEFYVPDNNEEGIEVLWKKSYINFNSICTDNSVINALGDFSINYQQSIIFEQSKVLLLKAISMHLN